MTEVVKVRLISMVASGRRVEFYAVMDENLEKANLLPQVEVEDGFPVTQFARRKASSGTLSLVLADDAVTAPKTQIYSYFERTSSGRLVERTRSVPPDKAQQKLALDFLFDIKKAKSLAVLASDLESVANVVIESISYRRGRATNVYYADVRWFEIKVGRTQTRAVELVGKLDPSREAGNTFLDAPTLEYGYAVNTAQPHNDPVVTTETKQSAKSWKNLWGLF